MAEELKNASKKPKHHSRGVERIYKGADSYLQEQAQTIHNLLVKDKAALAAIDIELADPFATNFQNAIDITLGEVMSSVIRARLKGKTEDVSKTMQACRGKYTEVIFFAQKAFPKNKAVWREFGRGAAYKKASSGKEAMFGFMTQLNATANRLSAALIAKGYSQAQIDDILTVRDSLLAIRSAQRDFKIARPELTAKRTTEYNTVYTLLMQVIRAAKLAFKNDAAKLGEYIYRPVIRKRKRKASG